MHILKVFAIPGNILIGLWIVFNAIDSGFKGTKAEITSSLLLIVLLGLNTALLSMKNK
jgi:hypothetical protein